jgi:putative flippase GtrA
VVTWKRIAELLRAGVAGVAATGSDLATLTILVSLFHVDPHVANVPALLVGGVVNFLGNRHFAFRAREGHVGKQAVGYTAVEVVALVLNGVLYDVALRAIPGAAHLYWLVRLATSHAVFLLWSFPLWRRVFRVAPAVAPDDEGELTGA